MSPIKRCDFNYRYIAVHGYPQDLAFALMIIATVVCYFTVFVFESSKATTQLGLVCNFFTIIFFAAPLATMVMTLATHETRTPPLISTLVLCMTQL